MLSVVLVLAVFPAFVAGFKCPSPGYFPDPNNCELFYHCAHTGSEIPAQSCAPNAFNPRSNICDFRANVPECDGKTPAPTPSPKPTTKPGPNPTTKPGPKPTTKPVPTTKPKPTEPLPAHDREVVCYFINWAWYRKNGGKYMPEDIDPRLCTIVNYAFAVLGWNKIITMHDSWADKDNKFYERVVAMKKAPGSKIKKVYIAIGGWNDSAGSKYSEMVSDPAMRKKFNEHVVSFMQQYGFDGLDLDWEYPKCWQGDCRKGKESEKADFATWCDELKALFKPHGFGLSAAVSASKTIIDAGYDVPRLAKSLDELNLMTYDFHGSWEKFTGHNAPMYQCEGDKIPFFNVDSAVKYWIKKGFPAKKIMLGLPIYGRSFKLDDANVNGIGAPANDGGAPGKMTRAKGFLGYYEICQHLKFDGWTKVQGANCTVGPYAYKGREWVGYDDIHAVEYKMNYIKLNNLGGAMVWDVTMDDFRNECGEGKNPFLTAINHFLAGDVTPQPCC